MSLPWMRRALNGLMDRLTVQVVRRVALDNEVVEEVMQEECVSGVLLPMQATKISVKAEGERAWKWYTFISSKRFELGWSFIDVATGDRYRVMAVEDYDRAGFFNYDLVQRSKEGTGHV
jgi:hypothetical protein